jgi:putative hemin transport protein
MRERELSTQLGISEAELVAAHCGEGVSRIEPRVGAVLNGLTAVGEVMALTRNESAVHEKIGVYDKVSAGEHNAIVLNRDIDLRIFPKAWAHAFAVEKRGEGEVRHSLQFFDAAGEAVHKVHLRPASNLYAFQKLVADLRSANQEPAVDVVALHAQHIAVPSEAAGVEDLRSRWSKLTDVHEFFGMLKALKLERRQAVRMVGDDYAWKVDRDAVSALMHHAAAEATPIMCFVGNRGCIQIHSGPIRTIKPMGPWLNVLDETFHLHLRLDHIDEVWGVRKPTRDGFVTSIEAYDANGAIIIQFFGERHEGETERADWRLLAENLPKIPADRAV